MEVITTTDLYFHGTHGYSRVTRSFAAFGGSCAPDNNDRTLSPPFLPLPMQVLNEFFHNVCELDLVFNFYKVNNCPGL